jgi:hypothetical protein
MFMYFLFYNYWKLGVQGDNGLLSSSPFSTQLDLNFQIYA